MNVIVQYKNIIKKTVSYVDNILHSVSLYYVVETADWVVQEVGRGILKNLNDKISSKITYTGYGIKNSLIHYGTEGVFFNAKKIKTPHKSNKIIVTWFHIKEDDTKLKKIHEADTYVNIWHTSCTITQKKLIQYGIDRKKIRVIPIGIDLDVYKPLPLNEIEKDREKIGVAKKSIVIGSFQKDGNGWGEGLEPKAEKGPDIFCDVIEKLSKKYDIFVLLTGPARGYVIERLKKMNVKFHHEYLKNPNDVVNYFQLCNLYIVASREEGGPKAILESMACGVPIVSTKVGMAPDMIKDGENGFLCDVEDTQTIYDKCRLILDKKIDKDSLINNAFQTVKAYDYKILSNDYMRMYKELL